MSIIFWLRQVSEIEILSGYSSDNRKNSESFVFWPFYFDFFGDLTRNYFFRNSKSKVARCSYFHSSSSSRTLEWLTNLCKLTSMESLSKLRFLYADFSRLSDRLSSDTKKQNVEKTLAKNGSSSRGSKCV